MDTPPLSTVRNWRAVSIAASFRLEAEPGDLAHLLSDDEHRSLITISRIPSKEALAIDLLAFPYRKPQAICRRALHRPLRREPSLVLVSRCTRHPAVPCRS